MNASTDLSIVTLIMNASPVVQAVMGLLLFASLFSWITIFQKWIVIARTEKLNNDFEKRFWSGADLARLYEDASKMDATTGIQERVFVAGMSEFLRRQNASPAETVPSVRRSMTASFQRELDSIERGLPTLASIGSVSPYIGLFGTVWGIMHAFTGLANLENANLSVVAPGIAEALIATAIGLFAAIPATAAYNIFAQRVERICSRYESFGEEFLNIISRNR